MLTRYKVDTTAGAPQIAYRETITMPATGEGKQIKQTGGSGQYGHAIVEVRPAASGSGIVIEDKVVGGRIPRQFIGSTWSSRPMCPWRRCSAMPTRSVRCRKVAPAIR